MRLLPLLSAAALAACNPADQPDRNAAESAAIPSANQAAPAPAPQVPAPAPTVSAEASIPAAFRGVYDRDEAACAAPGEYRMEVAAADIRFHESIGKVRKVEILGADRVSVEADYQGEGESWSNVRELRLSDGGRTIAVSGEGTDIVRRRCSGPAAR